MTAPAGSVVGLYVDLVRRIVPDDVIETQTGRRYAVLQVREQTRGKHAGRQHLRALVLDADAPIPNTSAVHRIRWYKR